LAQEHFMTVNSQLKHNYLPDSDGWLGTTSQRLRGACDASGLKPQADQILQLFEWLATRSSHRQAAVGVGDGLSAFEVSITSGSQPGLTLTFALKDGEGPGASGLLSLLGELAKDHHLDPKRFEAVQDLYFPEGRRPAFPARLSVSFVAGRAPHFSVYLDPAVSGLTLAPLCVERTLVRSGFTAAWPIIGQRLTLRGPDTDALKYVAIDLSSATPRIEVYARHQDCNVADLEAAASAAPTHVAGDVAAFLNVLGVPTPQLNGLPPLTCYEFASGKGARPDHSALEFPICDYAPDDRAIQRDLLACLAQFGLSGEGYAGAVKALAEVPLEQGLGLHTHVALWRGRDGVPNVRVRFPLHRGTAGTIAKPNPGAPVSGVMEVVDRYESWDQITNHPFLHRLRSEPVNLHHIWNILANFQGSISKTFSQRLALIASRTDDPETRFIVTDLLYDEMGSGDYSLAHVNLFSNMMKVMEPWKPSVVDAWTMSPATRFNRSMDETYGSPDINVALGAIVSGEIFGKQFDQFLGDEIRRQSEVDPALFVWVTLHESLEVTHAGEGAEIARLVPPEGLAAMARGAYGLSLGAWGFLTDVYEICYGERPRN